MSEGASVVVYSTATCGWCYRAKDLLTRNRIPFDAVDVTGDYEARADLVDRAGGRRTVPVIFIEGRPIGGYEELAALLASGGLEHLKT
jgi:glutaredoxin 3